MPQYQIPPWLSVAPNPIEALSSGAQVGLHIAGLQQQSALEQARFANQQQLQQQAIAAQAEEQARNADLAERLAAQRQMREDQQLAVQNAYNQAHLGLQKSQLDQQAKAFADMQTQRANYQQKYAEYSKDPDMTLQDAAIKAMLETGDVHSASSVAQMMKAQEMAAKADKEEKLIFGNSPSGTPYWRLGKGFGFDPSATGAIKAAVSSNTEAGRQLKHWSTLEMNDVIGQRAYDREMTENHQPVSPAAKRYAAIHDHVQFLQSLVTRALKGQPQAQPQGGGATGTTSPEAESFIKGIQGRRPTGQPAPTEADTESETESDSETGPSAMSSLLLGPMAGVEPGNAPSAPVTSATSDRNYALSAQAEAKRMDQERRLQALELGLPSAPLPPTRAAVPIAPPSSAPASVRRTRNAPAPRLASRAQRPVVAAPGEAPFIQPVPLPTQDSAELAAMKGTPQPFQPAPAKKRELTDTERNAVRARISDIVRSMDYDQLVNAIQARGTSKDDDIFKDEKGKTRQGMMMEARQRLIELGLEKADKLGMSEFE
ncbi:MAG TPA: hypothetical protein VF077_13010 [Nitrospiraceae bacterium]